MSGFNLSIIVPVLNEADQLTALMNRLRVLKDEWVKEIIIVDGGSTDGTKETLEKEFTVIDSEKGRAKQMNAGAKIAEGTWLMFLHADTHISQGHVQTAMGDGVMYKWGRFDVKLSNPAWPYSIIGFFINKRSRLTNVSTGDQCLFVRKKAFDEVGGFDDIPLMEDVAIAKKLKAISKPINLKKTVTTSSRRWEQCGIVKTIILMWKLRFYYWCGVSPDRLANLYRHNGDDQN